MFAFLSTSCSTNLYSTSSFEVTCILAVHSFPLIINITSLHGSMVINVLSSSKSLTIILPFSTFAPLFKIFSEMYILFVDSLPTFLILTSLSAAPASLSLVNSLFSSKISISTFLLKKRFSSFVILYFSFSLATLKALLAFAMHSSTDEPENNEPIIKPPSNNI